MRKPGNERSGTPQPLAFVAGGRQAGFHPFRDANALRLRDRGDDGNHGVAEGAAGSAARRGN